MKAVTKETLRRVMSELPAVGWSDSELDELVAPKFGVITGFQRFLDDVEAIARADLGESGLPGPLPDRTAAR